MSAFPKYPAYKDSGVEWLGEVPEHWGVYPNRRLFEEKKVPVGKRAHEYKLLSLTLNGVIPRDMENPKGKFPAEFNTYSEVEPDDLVFCLFDLDETPRTVGISPCAGMITGAYTILKPKREVNPKYQFYYYLSLDEKKALKPLYTGLRKTISRSSFASAKSPCPPRAEQDRIVAFLDEKTAQIDALIAKKQRQIELLDEQKTILINRAVTRGLQPNPDLQDSGIPWIGPIPKGWEVKRFRYCAHIRGGQVDPRREPYRFMTLIAPDHVESGTGQILGLQSAQQQGADSGKYQVQAGDLIYSKIRPNLRKAVSTRGTPSGIGALQARRLRGA
jgi:type I restriction enzyme S subunit